MSSRKKRIVNKDSEQVSKKMNIRSANYKVKIKRGDVFYIKEIDGYIGSEQGGCRPGVVIQNDTGNKHSPTVIIAYLTSKSKNDLPVHSRAVIKGVENVVLCEQIRTIEKSRLLELIYRMTPEEIKDMDEKLYISLNLKKDGCGVEEEVSKKLEEEISERMEVEIRERLEKEMRERIEGEIRDEYIGMLRDENYGVETKEEKIVKSEMRLEMVQVEKYISELNKLMKERAEQLEISEVIRGSNENGNGKDRLEEVKISIRIEIDKLTMDNKLSSNVVELSEKDLSENVLEALADIIQKRAEEKEKYIVDKIQHGVEDGVEIAEEVEKEYDISECESSETRVESENKEGEEGEAEKVEMTVANVRLYYHEKDYNLNKTAKIMGVNQSKLYRFITEHDMRKSNKKKNDERIEL